MAPLITYLLKGIPMKRQSISLIACTTLLMTGLSSLHAGVILEGTTTTQQGQRTELARVRLSVQAANARLDFVEGRHTGSPETGYLVTTNAAQTITMVDTEAKSYMDVDINRMGALAGQVVQASGGLVGLDVTDQSVELLLEERGPDMHGYPTQHRRFKTSYKMKVSILGIKRSSTVVNEEEVWVTTKFSDSGFDMWRKRGQLQTGIESLDKLVEAEAAKTEGIPLKRIVTSTITDGKGKRETTTSTTEVTSVKRGGLANSLFTIPDGYTDGMVEIRGELDAVQQAVEAAESEGPKGDDADSSVVHETLKSVPFVGRLFGSKPQP
jgi:hypothetical protein